MVKCTRSWHEEDRRLEELEIADPFAHLFDDPPPDTEWTDEDSERLIDAADLTLFGY